jgi:hypothetical protein
MMPCCSITVIEGGVVTKRCGAEASYQDVTGAYCLEHWDPEREPRHWYVNGLRWGWDERHPDPTINL